MELGIFFLLAGVLFGIGAIYDELHAIRLALETRPDTPSPIATAESEQP